MTNIIFFGTSQTHKKCLIANVNKVSFFWSINEGAVQTGELGAQESLEGMEEKKKGTRKALFKQQALAVGTSKKMFVQAVLSPRKKAQGKIGKRQGEAIRKKEDKGPSNPKPPQKT